MTPSRTVRLSVHGAPRGFAVFVGVLALAGCSRRSPSDDAARAPSADLAPSATPSAPSSANSEAPSGAQPTASPSTSGAGSRAPDDARLAAAMKKLCTEAPCTGPFDSVRVWRNPQGSVGALEHRGDIRRCSHPPTTFYDAAGTRLDAIPEKPVVPGSAEQRGFQATRDRILHGLVQAEASSCAPVK